MTLIEKLKSIAKAFIPLYTSLGTKSITLSTGSDQIICHTLTPTSCAMQTQEQDAENTSYYLGVKKETADGEKITIHKVYDKLTY